MNSNLLRVLAVLLALGAIATAVIGYRLSMQPVVTAKAPSAPPTYPQVVAAREVPAGHLLTAEDVRLESVTQRDSHGYDSVDLVVGKLTLAPMAAGATVLSSYFPTLGAVAQMLRPGERGVAIKVNEVIGVGGFVSPGDHVDVLFYLRADRETDNTSSAQVVLRDVRVLAFGEDVGENEAAQSFTLKKMTAGSSKDKPEATKKQDDKKGKASRSAILAVPEKEAARLMLADSSGLLRLSLRGAEPPQQFAQNEDASRYLKLAEVAKPGTVRPVLVSATTKPNNKTIKKIKRTTPSDDKKSQVIVHRGEQMEVVSVRN